MRRIRAHRIAVVVGAVALVLIPTTGAEANFAPWRGCQAGLSPEPAYVGLGVTPPSTDAPALTTAYTYEENSARVCVLVFPSSRYEVTSTFTNMREVSTSPGSVFFVPGDVVQVCEYQPNSNTPMNCRSVSVSAVVSASADHVVLGVSSIECEDNSSFYGCDGAALVVGVDGPLGPTYGVYPGVMVCSDRPPVSRCF